ncbi:hypothetical protein TNCV_1324661 [Trichonephila clavipes]|nr:hypothetical protein TNCV_1324661 [Trichonephila clavipes]
MFSSWLSASTSFHIEVRGSDHRKPSFLASHGLDAEKVEEQMRIPASVPEQSRFEIMLSQSKVPIELTFFFVFDHLCDAASLNMNTCVSITTDGAQSMIGMEIGTIMLLKEHLAHCGVELLQLHCIIHQENL